MTKQEQIEEMAKIVDEMYNVYTTTADDIAEGLYNAGYRKIDDFEAENKKHKAKLNARLTCDFVKTAQTHAVQDFAKRLKKCSYCDNDFMDGKWHRYVLVSDIDELLKEYEG